MGQQKRHLSKGSEIMHSHLWPGMFTPIIAEGSGDNFGVGDGEGSE